jgi:hypothetical protein
MAFEFYVSSNNSQTTSLSDGAPFKFESLDGISSAPIIRFEQRGPVQQGVTDLGYRLGARVMELSLLFYASTDSELDDYRQQLMDAFKPLTETPIFLYCERDDAATRRLVVHTVDDIAITLTPELRPGHSHRATLKLRAASPLWRNETVQSASYAGTIPWYLAGGYIGSANVMEYVESPTQGQAWTYAGNITGAWSIVFRTSPTVPGVGSLTPTVFHVGSANLGAPNSTKDAVFTYYSTDSDFRWGRYPGDNTYGSVMPSGTRNYFGQHDGTYLYAWYDGTVNYMAAGSAAVDVDITGVTRRWRSDRGNSSADYRWGPAVEKAAVFDIALSETQRVALDASMGSAIIATFSAVNDGDVPVYPVIKVTGPMSNITITNSTTGDSFSLGTIAVDSGDIYTIDLRDGDKQVYDLNGTDRLSQVTSPVALAGFRLEPSPVAAGGTNTITVAGSAISSATRVTVEHYNQYMSY